MTASGTGEPGDCRQQKQKRTATSRTAPSQQDRGTHKKWLRILEFAMHRREHISPWRRTRRRHDAFRRRRKVAWSRSRKWAGYIIATNDAPRDGHQSTVDSVLTPSTCLPGAAVRAHPASVRGYRVRHGIRAGRFGGITRRFCWDAFTIMINNRAAPVSAKDN